MKRIMGIDYGSARIGVALSDELQLLAHPAETVPATNHVTALERIVALAKEKNVERIVIGLPRHMNGSLGASANQVRRFAESLRALVDFKIETWDERLSTVAAQRSLHAAGKSSRKTRAIIDQVAAQILLQSYLDSLQLNPGA
ncbi:MAG TPA: Holliday junction resolvase RuvX [Chthoniobacterales bacterium]|jgi:putative Holliday junction resolvase